MNLNTVSQSFFRGFFIALIAAFALAACSGGGSSGSTTTTPTSTTGTISGVVIDNSTGTPIANATVTSGTSTVTTDASGAYSLTGLTASSRAVVNISATNYADGSRITAVFANGTSRADAALLPVAYTGTIDPTLAQTVTVPGSTASVALAANSLVTASNAPPSGNVSVSVTPIDPSSNPQIMPGDFSTDAGGQIESFGALDVTLRDATGAPLNLASGTSSTINIPVAAGTTPTPTMDLWYYDSATGQWTQQGTLTLGGTAPNQYYTGTVSHFSTWNADQLYNTTCVTGRVVDANGNAVGNARVDSEGQGYIGTSLAYSAADGTFTIRIKANSFAILTASKDTALSSSEVVLGGAAGTTCTAMSTDLALGSATSGSARIKLTWGTDPSDLDSHLTGPIAGSSTRFHVYYGNSGSLTTSPFAQLDVDDTSGFGPEVITISRFTPGVYHYSVHHYSGVSTILGSPARVELVLNGVTRVFTPPSCATTSVWAVMDLTVDNVGNISVTPVNTCLTVVPASTFGSGTTANGAKPPMVGGNW